MCDAWPRPRASPRWRWRRRCWSFRLPNFPRSIVFIHPLLAGAGLLALRLLARMRAERSSQGALRESAQPLLVLGSLDDAATVLQTLRASQQWRAVAIYSPAPAEAGRSLQGMDVLGPPLKLGVAARQLGVSHALVAGAAGSSARRLLLEQASDARLALLTLLRADDWLQAGAGAPASGPRMLELDDLLGREAVQLDVRGLSELLAGRCALVSGAGGSIGSELCRQLARFGVGKLVCVDVSEFAITSWSRRSRRATRSCRWSTSPPMCARPGACACCSPPTGPRWCFMPPPTSMCR
jgi:Predicted nucleoside-diphosphate sugar epimerases